MRFVSKIVFLCVQAHAVIAMDKPDTFIKFKIHHHTPEKSLQKSFITVTVPEECTLIAIKRLVAHMLKTPPALFSIAHIDALCKATPYTDKDMEKQLRELNIVNKTSLWVIKHTTEEQKQ